MQNADSLSNLHNWQDLAQPAPSLHNDISINYPKPGHQYASILTLTLRLLFVDEVKLFS
jgi:hypothetical protein